MTTWVVEPVEHSRLGPSSSERWINCPASVKATEAIPDEQSIYAAEGGAAHFIADRCFQYGHKAEQFIGDVIHVGKHKFGISHEFTDHVQEFLDWCAEVNADHFSETRVSYERWVKGGFGTVDRIAIQKVAVPGKTFAWLRDLKFGTGVQVYAKENTQLMLYALGALEDFSWVYGDIDGFFLGIHQPRLDHKDEWFITTKDLLAWAKATLYPAVNAVYAGKQFKAGDWCKFCKLRRDCAVRAETATKDIVFADLDAQSDTIIDKAKYAALLPLLKSWIADFEKGLVADLLAGKTVDGWKLVEGRSNRAWSNPDAVARRISPDDAFEKSLRSPAQLEKLLGKPKFAKILGDLVHKPPGKPVLAPAGDPRDSLDTTNIVDFKDLDSGD